MGRTTFFLKFIRKSLRTYARVYSSDFILSGSCDKRIHVLGNGPSLNKSLHLIGNEDDVVMVNFSAATDLFRQLEPRYLCLADPSFFEKTGIELEEQKKEAFFCILNNLDWKITVVLPSYAKKYRLPIQNDNVLIQYVNTVPIDFSVKYIRFWLYRKNLAMPALQNVVIMALYAAAQRGHQTIYLHGVDSDSYKNICINKNNEMVFKEYHYYGDEYRNLNAEKYYGFTTGSLYKRLECEVTMFRSYIDLANYAKYLGIKVLNASPRSMIDAFERCEHPDEIP